MKTLYICGDSFACADTEYPVKPWVELLQDQISGWSIHNLSRVCASNLHIRLQVDQAITEHADYVIMLATTCTRGQGKVNHKRSNSKNLIDRFYQIGAQESVNHDKDLACYSINSLDYTCVLNHKQMAIVEDYRNLVFDLELEIFQNKCTIESSLYALEKSQIPYIFDQGGFENPKFGVADDKKYFAEFNHRRSEINLWSEFNQPMQHRPYFHITDSEVHKRVAKYYASRIQESV